MPKFRTAQNEADYNLCVKMLDRLKRGETMTDQDKGVAGIIARRLPEGDLRRQALALYNHLMLIGA